MLSESRDDPTNCRYYNEVSVSRTTTSSGLRHVYTVVVLWVALTLVLFPRPAAGAGPLDDDESGEESGGGSVFPLQVAWTTDLGQAPAADPGYDDIHAYVPLRDGTLSAVRLSDGAVAWTVDQPTTFPPLPGAESVIVADDASLVARRVTDGQLLWILDLSHSISAAPIRHGGWLVVALSGGDLVTLRATDGHEYWRRSFGGSLHARPSLGGDRIFVPVDDGRLVALDLLTGALVWERQLRGSPGEVLPLDSLFVGSTDNFLYRLSRDEGKVEWRWRTGGDIVGVPVVDEDRLYFVSLDNLVYSLDRDSGVQQWRRDLSGRPRASPSLIGGILVVSGVSKQVRTFESKTGESTNTLSAPGELGAPPFIDSALDEVGLRMVLLVADGRLIGMGPASGPPEFSLDFPPPPLLPGPELFVPADVLPFEPLVPGDTEPAIPPVQTGPLGHDQF